jgi:trehalose-6-phosphate synthase
MSTENQAKDFVIDWAFEVTDLAKSKSKPRTVVVSTRIPITTFNKLEQRARREDRSVGGLLRSILRLASNR